MSKLKTEALALRSRFETWREKYRGVLVIWVVVGLLGSVTAAQNFRESRCDREFRAALVARSEPNKRADRLEQEQDKVIDDFVNDLTHPPVHIRGKFDMDRQVWLEDVGARAAVRTHQLIADRAQALADRDAHPLPEISCGR